MLDAAKQGLGIGRIIEPAAEKALADGSLTPVLEDYWMTYPGLYLYFVQNMPKADPQPSVYGFPDG